MLLAFDLDNTLVRRDQVLPQEIAAEIQAARQQGHQVTILTGRNLPSATPYLDQLDVHSYFSVNHGALVVGADGEVLRQATIASHVVKTLVEAYQDVPKLEFSCIVGNRMYVRQPDHERWTWARSMGQLVEQMSLFNGDAADKIVFHCPTEGERMHREITEAYCDLELYHWDHGFLEITAADAHKGAALALIAKDLGVMQHETVAFGDGINDVTMLAWAGRGVAVGPHAYPPVLAASDEHIEAPEQLGVAKWLAGNLRGLSEQRADNALPRAAGRKC